MQQATASVEGERKSKKSPRTQIKLKAANKEGRELCYISSVDLSTRTFFAQFCSNSLEDLAKHDSTIDEHCRKVIEIKRTEDSMRAKPVKLHNGDIVCAFYEGDERWYRAQVLAQDRAKGLVVIIFVDYGNFATLLVEQVLIVSSLELPELARAPYGLTCYIEALNALTHKDSARMLNTMKGMELMVDIISPVTNLEWLVEIPELEHPSNRLFWSEFKLKLEDDNIDVGGGGLGEEKPVDEPDGLSALGESSTSGETGEEEPSVKKMRKAVSL